MSSAKSYPKILRLFAWELAFLVTGLAFVAWGQSYRWRLGDLGILQIFPLLGLMAFSLMWAHYMTSFVRLQMGIQRKILKTYLEVTSFIVLVCLVLHPGLLIYKLWQNGLGLPPASYFNYVGKELAPAVALGSISLMIFLAYELRRKFVKSSWWKYVVWANGTAMIAIFVHGLRLGGQLMSGWYRFIWLIYGVLLVSLFVYQFLSRGTAKH
ncbi:MAG: hypothetical protein AAB459_03905 [Patescibacteria group bacterium]